MNKLMLQLVILGGLTLAPCLSLRAEGVGTVDDPMTVALNIEKSCVCLYTEVIDISVSIPWCPTSANTAAHLTCATNHAIQLCTCLASGPEAPAPLPQLCPAGTIDMGISKKNCHKQGGSSNDAMCTYLSGSGDNYTCSLQCDVVRTCVTAVS